MLQIFFKDDMHIKYVCHWRHPIGPSAILRQTLRIHSDPGHSTLKLQGLPYQDLVKSALSTLKTTSLCSSVCVVSGCHHI